MRKFVKPAHPGALIPDPDRGGFLPQDGIAVNWNHHWVRHLKQGNIIVEDEVVHPQATGPAKALPAAAEPAPAADTPSAEPPPPADKTGKSGSK